MASSMARGGTSAREAWLGRLSAAVAYLMLVLSVGMLGWGVLGFLEYAFGWVVLMPLQNATFPAGTQFLHWLLITAAGGTFLVGYGTRWRHTPTAMMVLWAMLASMCFIQTFDFMTNPGRHAALARECTYYVLFTIYLFRSDRMRAHFGRGHADRQASTAVVA